MIDIKKKIPHLVGAVLILFVGGALYKNYPTTAEVVAVDRAEYQMRELVDAMPVSLTDLKDNITPPAAGKTEPTLDLPGGYPVDTDSAEFDPTGGHEPDTNLALMRFCSSEEMMAAWSKEVDTVRRFHSTEHGIDVLVLTYLTGDWLVLGRDFQNHCYELDVLSLTSGLQAIDDVIAPKL